MASFDEYLNKATAAGPDRLIAGCVVAACKEGIVNLKCFGTPSVDPASPLCVTPISPDTILWVASCTKLMTAISALQCVEKGLLRLDDSIATVLDEWKQPCILSGFDEPADVPMLRRADREITLRMLLTHQSGMGYDFINSDLERYVRHREPNASAPWSIHDRYFLPLLFEPGSSWEYGSGTDWAGKMVEKVTGQRLDEYMKQHIWEPLGMDSTTFRLQERLDLKARRADMSERNTDGSIVPAEKTRWFPEETADDHGGAGVYSCVTDFMKLLAAILRDDGILLSEAGVELLFKPCLSEEAADKFQSVRTSQNDDKELLEMALPAPVYVNYAPGGMTTLEDIPGGRKAGSMSWGGLPNLSWILDRSSGLAMLYASQLLPPGDKVTQRIVRKFEAAVYSGEFFVGASQV